MANADNIGAVFSAEFLRLFRQYNVWRAVSKDYSTEVAQFGDSINIPGEVAVDFTETDVTKADAQGEVLANHTYGDPNIVSSTSVVLNIDKYMRINELIPGVTMEQVRFDLVSNAGERAATTFDQEFNRDIRGALTPTTVLDTDRQVGAFTVTAAQFLAGTQAAFLTNLGSALDDAAIQANYEHWPSEGRWAIVSSRVYAYLIRFLISENIHYQGDMNDQMVAGMSLPRFKGWTLVPDASPGDGTGNNDDGKHTIFYGVLGHGIASAMQTRFVKVRDSETFDGVRIQGRQQYGTKVNQATKLMKTLISIT